MERYDVVIVGGGPAGLAAALGARRAGAKTLLVEREARLGGILKQCIHDGFGLLRFGERLSGCEYAHRYIEMLRGCGAQTALLTFVSRIEKSGEGFVLTLVGREGLRKVEARALVLSTGCRERTARQVSIHGTRPAGVLTAGTAQQKLAVYLIEQGDMSISMTDLSQQLNLGRASLYRAVEELEESGAILRDGKLLKVLREDVLKTISRDKTPAD